MSLILIFESAAFERSFPRTIENPPPERTTSIVDVLNPETEPWPDPRLPRLPKRAPIPSLPMRERGIMLDLGTDPQRIHHAYARALQEASVLRHKLRESELRAEQCRTLIERTGGKLPWPPLTWPARPPTLHEAMRIVLLQRGNDWTRIDELTSEIARQGLYRRRDGLPASTADVSARSCSYRGWFIRHQYVIKLSDPIAPLPRRRRPGVAPIERTDGNDQVDDED
jgi:hypothetical protein